MHTFTTETETAVYSILMFDGDLDPVGFGETHKMTAAEAVDGARDIMNTKLEGPVLALMFKASGGDTLAAMMRSDAATLNQTFAGAFANDAAIKSIGRAEIMPRLAEAANHVLGNKARHVH